ncbi:MAG: HAMP domain-containing protein [Lachnospiraceae bacterium]|nr:HAMP domain-containing protein [Lachnospiraceae bacterium]
MAEKKEAAAQQEPKRVTIQHRLEVVSKLMKRSLTISIILLVILIGLATRYILLTYEGLEDTVYLNNYRIGARILTTAIRSYAVTGENQYYDDYIKEHDVENRMDVAWEVLQGNNIKADEWAILNQAEALSNEMSELEEKAIKAVQAGDTDEAVSIVFGDPYSTDVKQLRSLTDDVINTILKRLETQKMIALVMVIVCFIGLLIAIARFVYDANRLRKFIQNEVLARLVKIVPGINELANGNLHVQVDVQRSNDEFGDMINSLTFMKTNLGNIINDIAYVLGEMGQGNFKVSVKEQYVGEYVQIKDALEKIVEQMHDVVSTIVDVSRDIDGGAGQLAVAADDLANSCTNQAHDVSDLVNLLGELNEAIAFNENACQEAVKISNHASETLVTNNQKMEELKAAMKDISECSDQIVAVVSTISDIGSEIDLLSLNASIESARAGEAGRGFAVVAEQVKKLAGESQDAVIQTSDMIKRTVDAVAVGVNLAAEMAKTMEEMREGVEETNRRIEGILDKLKTEVRNIGHINEGVNDIAGLVDNNSATSEETAAVSEEQKSQVEMLIDIISRFNV